jgi:two-component system, OmpR family, sensor histidine kinase TctE
VLVGETTRKRDHLADEILVAVWVPEIVLMLIVAWMAYRVIALQTERIHRMSKALRDYSYTQLNILSGHDIPEELSPLLEALNAMLAKRERAALAQRAFIANAAHQLRTPLTAINLQAEQASHCTSIEAMRESVIGLHTAARRAARLANQLLLLSRAEPDAQSNRYRTRVDLHEVAFDAASVWIEKAMTKEIDLGFDDAAAHVSVEIDEALVREAINNLIDNALKYCSPGARVTVSVTGGSDPAVIVEDNGPGIPHAERGRVVQRFYRGDNASGEGTGLGLAIVHEVALAHAGAFVITDSPGAGTCCEIHLPPAPTRANEAGAADAPQRSSASDVPSPQRG